MIVKLLTEHLWSFYAYKEAVQARLSLHLSNCHIVEHHMSWLKSDYVDVQADMSLCWLSFHSVVFIVPSLWSHFHRFR